MKFTTMTIRDLCDHFWDFLPRFGKQPQSQAVVLIHRNEVQAVLIPCSSFEQAARYLQVCENKTHAHARG